MILRMQHDVQELTCQTSTQFTFFLNFFPSIFHAIGGVKLLFI